jgi:predicted DNA-binding transcriptional regulator AlpA
MPPTKTLPKAKAAPSPAHEPPRLIGPKDLPSLGINYSISHLRRMWNAGQFPKPVYPSARRFAWHVDVLEKWIAERVGKEEA